MADEEEKTDPKHEWKYKKEFGIVTEMRKAVTAARSASEAEIASLRRKLEKLTYGS